MARIFPSDSTGAEVYVVSNDHCPPHVHARHRGEGWVARVEFSYLSGALELMSIAPDDHPPRRDTLNRLLDDIQAQLPECRRAWWGARHTTGLVNRWVVVRAPGKIQLASKGTPGAQQIIRAEYDPTTGELQVFFRGGTKEPTRLRP